MASLWNGTKASLMLVSNPAIKFTFYELMKRQYLKMTGQQVGGTSAFLLGAVATAIATVLTYPLQIVQAKARVSYLHKSNIALAILCSMESNPVFKAIQL